MLDITTPISLCVCCFWIICLYTQLNQPCVWNPTFGAWALCGSSQGVHCLVEVSPSCPAAINSPASSITSGEAGWTVRGAHLHHALGTSQVRASGPDPCLLRGLGSNRISGALGTHLDHLEPGLSQGGIRGPESPKYHCTCGIVSYRLI